MYIAVYVITTHLDVYTCQYTCTHARAHAHTQMHTHVHMHLPTLLFLAYICPCMHTHVHTHAHRAEWKETARWLKFVEVAEPGGQKWSKPHVSTLSMHSLFQLRDLLLNAVVLLDETGKDMPQIAGVGHLGVIARWW